MLLILSARCHHALLLGGADDLVLFCFRERQELLQNDLAFVLTVRR